MQRPNMKGWLFVMSITLQYAFLFLGCNKVEETVQSERPLFSVVDTSRRITFASSMQESDILEDVTETWGFLDSKQWYTTINTIITQPGLSWQITIY